MVGPAPFTPFTRVVIVDAGDHYETGLFTWWPTAVTFDPEHIAKNVGEPTVKQARADPRIREFLVWARFPFWTVTPEKDGTRVSVGDVRFMSQSIRQANFQASTIVRSPGAP
jgi:hypothetical protein